MIYRLEILPSAMKEITALPTQIRRRVDKAILSLASDPWPGPPRSVPLKGGGKEGLSRLRVGQYRVIYCVKKDRLVVLVVRVAHRREAYRGSF